jgi:hypothetical protein
MGIRDIMQKKKAEYLKQRAETKGYRRLVAEKTKLARRQAYADEAVKVARERARAAARQPTFGQRLGALAVRATTPRPVARPVVRRATTRKAVRGVGARRRTSRRAVRRYAPAPRRQAPAQAPRQMAPANLNQAIYGGY